MLFYRGGPTIKYNQTRQIISLCIKCYKDILFAHCLHTLTPPGDYDLSFNMLISRRLMRKNYLHSLVGRFLYTVNMFC